MGELKKFAYKNAFQELISLRGRVTNISVFENYFYITLEKIGEIHDIALRVSQEHLWISKQAEVFQFIPLGHQAEKLL